MDRIKELVNYIEGFEYLADVGCDHGYLIVEAFKKYNLKQAIAIDNKKGPLSQAIENIKTYEFNSEVIYSLSSGIKEINELTDVVVIAGMGGMLISDILNDGIDVAIKRIKKRFSGENYEIYLSYDIDSKYEHIKKRLWGSIGFKT